MSRLPRAAKTEKKRKNPAPPRREQNYEPIMEDLEKENEIGSEIGSEFEEPSAIRGAFGEQGPTSIKSAPVFNNEDAGPMSYEDFGHGIDKRDRYARR